MCSLNILFIANTTIDPSHGGVEKVTCNIARELMQLGHCCSIVFSLGSNYKDSPFSQAVKMDLFEGPIDIIATNIINFIRTNDIDVVINQQIHSSKRLSILKIIKKTIDIKLIYCFHGDPIIYTKKYLLKTVVQRWNLRNFFRFILYQFYIPNERQLVSMYNLADKFVVLSKSHFSTLQNIYKFDLNKNKLVAIPNFIVNDVCLDIDFLNNKEKIVLIVARLHEKDKGILSSLRIWKRIKEQNIDWKLQILGDGPDRELYEHFVTENAINDVCFMGNVFGVEYYYKKASLLMVTSPCEGFGMTLLEAQQYGCIPIAFDAFSALHDIVIDGENGRIISNKNEQMFINVMLFMMRNIQEREIMKKSCLHFVENFSSDSVIKLWLNLLEKKAYD